MHAKEDEKYYGLGDTTREHLQKRGTVADIWVKNVICVVLMVIIMLLNFIIENP